MPDPSKPCRRAIIETAVFYPFGHPVVRPCLSLLLFDENKKMKQDEGVDRTEFQPRIL
jgi:hypothetical protein